ncbi:MAG: sulfatase [Planctomycetota bacterium]
MKRGTRGKKAILIMLDTLRRDFLGCYGSPWVKTPRLDALARETAVFEDFRTASYPTVPCRRDIATGRFSFPWRGWEPLTDEHPILAQALNPRGVVTQMILDTPHLVRHGFGFDRHFQGFWLLRGQEDDSFNTDPVNRPLPAPREKLRDAPPGIYDQCLRNTVMRRTDIERDYFAPRLFEAAEEWLERNRSHEDFFLWIDSFSPHEPWETPFPYNEMYDPGYKGPRLTYPRNGRSDYATAREHKNMVALYAGMITFVDKWVGRFIDKVKELGMWDDTLLIVTSDHGIYLGEHGMHGKISGTLYEECVRVPFFLHHPDGRAAGRRIRGFAQHPDIMPTILDHFGVPVPESVHGSSLLPRLSPGKASRPARPFGMFSQAKGPISWQTDRFLYVRWPRDPERIGKLKAAHLGCAGCFEDELYDLHKDPGETRNVIRKHPAAAALDRDLRAFLAEKQAPASFFSNYGWE